MPSRVKMIGIINGEYYGGISLKKKIRQWLEAYKINLSPKGWRGWVDAFMAAPMPGKELIVFREPRNVVESRSRYKYIVKYYGITTTVPRARRRLAFTTLPLQPPPRTAAGRPGSPLRIPVPTPRPAPSPLAPEGGWPWDRVTEPTATAAARLERFIDYQREAMRGMPNEPITSWSAGNVASQITWSQGPDQPVREAPEFQDDDGSPNQ